AENVEVVPLDHRADGRSQDHHPDLGSRNLFRRGYLRNACHIGPPKFLRVSGRPGLAPIWVSSRTAYSIKDGTDSEQNPHVEFPQETRRPHHDSAAGEHIGKLA